MNCDHDTMLRQVKVPVAELVSSMLEQGSHVSFVCHVSTESGRLAAARSDSLDDFLCPVGAAGEVHDDRRAVARQTLAHAAADAAEPPVTIATRSGVLMLPPSLIATQIF